RTQAQKRLRQRGRVFHGNSRRRPAKQQQRFAFVRCQDIHLLQELARERLRRSRVENRDQTLFTRQSQRRGYRVQRTFQLKQGMGCVAKSRTHGLHSGGGQGVIG